MGNKQVMAFVVGTVTVIAGLYVYNTFLSDGASGKSDKSSFQGRMRR